MEALEAVDKPADRENGATTAVTLAAFCERDILPKARNLLPGQYDTCGETDMWNMVGIFNSTELHRILD